VANHCRFEFPRAPLETIQSRCGGYDNKLVAWGGPDHASVPGVCLCVGGRPVFVSEAQPSEAQLAEIVAFIATRELPACSASGHSAAGLHWGAPVAIASAAAYGAIAARGRGEVEAFYRELWGFKASGAAPATWPHKA
jgi:hypothetical protein